MDIILTLDYELFLGSKTGSVDKCLVKPLALMEQAVAPAKFTIFVDAAYLLRLSELRQRHPALGRDFDQIASHLRQLQERGHDLQLHVHPHWASSTFDGEGWTLDHGKYKLSDWPQADIARIFRDSKLLLDGILGKKTTAFRAGGFSAQPTSLLAGLMRDNQLAIDSSVTPRIAYNSPQQLYDYTQVPMGAEPYRFSADIQRPDPQGDLAEAPIAVAMVSPLFYWKYAFSKLARRPRHKNMGDGLSVKASGESIRQRLLSRSPNIATIDGMKIDLLAKQRDQASARGQRVFTVIGHPKLATEHSVRKLAEFAKSSTDAGHVFKTISQLSV